MAPKDSQLSALVALIADATKIVEAHYKKVEVMPYVPSLDNPDAHPLDTVIADDKELCTAIQTVEGACSQLCATIARPNHTLLNRFMGGYELACLRAVMEFKIADILQESPSSSGLHISDIGKKAGIEEGKLGRVLRLLASKHIFREVSANVFANNRLSMQLLSSNPLTNMGFHFTDLGFKSAALLPEVLADPEWGSSYEPHHTAFNKYTGFPGKLFEYFETSEGTKIGAQFAIGMAGWSDAVKSNAIVQGYPWGELGQGASVCDVGGGIGNVTILLAKRFPTLQLKLQDLPERILQARNEFWPRNCPEAIREKRIEFQSMDFLTESPIKNCNVYLLKNIIHNWPDADGIKILTGVRKAMAPYSRVLVHEYVLQDANKCSADLPASGLFKPAPEPLLSNFGEGRIRQYNIDIHMMVVLNSMERRLHDFIRLGNAAGLQFERVWDLGDRKSVV